MPTYQGDYLAYIPKRLSVLKLSADYRGSYAAFTKDETNALRDSMDKLGILQHCFTYNAHSDEIDFTFDYTEPHNLDTEMQTLTEQYEMLDFELKVFDAFMGHDRTVSFPFSDHLSCINCKYIGEESFGGRPNRPCKRFDHDLIKVWGMYFFCYTHKRQNCAICRDFEPREDCVYANHYYRGFDVWRKAVDRETDRKHPDMIVTLKQEHDDERRFYVDYDDFVNGTMFDGNRLKAKAVGYTAIDRKSPTGYKAVKESLPNGIVVEGWDSSRLLH